LCWTEHPHLDSAGCPADDVRVGAVSVFLIDTNKVLPKNPMSIAASTSLLADPNMVRRRGADGAGMIPAESVWCDDKESRRGGIFEGVTYTMDWWSRLAEKQKSMKYYGPEGEGV